MLKAYGGWIKVKNLPLDFWCRSILEVIGDHFGGLIEIATETLNFTNCSEAHIKVKKNNVVLFHQPLKFQIKRGEKYFYILETLSF